MRRKLISLSTLLVLAAGGLVAVAPSPAAAAGGQTPTSDGYWLVASDGGMFSYGGAQFRGSAGGTKLNRPVVGMAATASGHGYWLVATDGGIFAYGDAPFVGSAGAARLNQPIVGMAATPSGRGYWLVAADGGIFAYGDAPFVGSAGATRLNQPIVGMAATPSGRGYWLVARDGGVFSYGDAVFRGSTGGIKLNQPVVAMAPTPSARGYWMFASDGGVFAFGDAVFKGSMGNTRLNRPIVAAAAAPRGVGYWLTASDGGMFSFGDAAFAGSAATLRLAAPVVGMAAPPIQVHPEVGLFFYPWYARADVDGVWRHWDANGRTPPDDLASDFYPVRGPYSSTWPATLDSQMAEIAAAGVDTVISSWWGTGSFEDQDLGNVITAAHAHGLKVAVHLEPYGGRSVTSVTADIHRLHAEHGVNDFYLYEAMGPAASDWATMSDTAGDVRIFAEDGNLAAVKNGTFAAYVRDAHFDGMYTYDPVRYAPSDFGPVCGSARQVRVLCAPSVAPGYSALRTLNTTRAVARSNGARYDGQWQGAIAGGADLVTITSYNEWHEGSQIEPAAPHCFPDGYCTPGYEGAYNLTGDAANPAYLQRTQFWSTQFRSARP
jgi:hypothetical protein